MTNNNEMINNVATVNEAVEAVEKKPEFRYVNFYAGYKFVASVDGAEFSWNLGKKVLDWANSYPETATLKLANKDLKAFGLENINAFIDNVYYRLADVRILRNKAEAATIDKETRARMVRVATSSVLHLWRSLGQVNSRDWLWEREFTFLEELIAAKVSTPTVMKEGRRMDITDCTTFRKSFWNALFLAARGKDVLEKSMKFVEKSGKAYEAAQKKVDAEKKKAAAAEKKAAAAAKKAAKAAAPKKLSKKDEEIEALKAQIAALLAAQNQQTEQNDAE